TWWGDRPRRLAADAQTTLGAALLDSTLDGRTSEILGALARSGYEVVEPAAWPRLLTLPDPPAVMFQRGQANVAKKSPAVVGARQATAYGLRVCEALAGGVAREGVAVLSGLARGIDARAHVAALAAGGKTVAVLGCGPDQVYPPENAALQERIGREG